MKRQWLIYNEHDWLIQWRNSDNKPSGVHTAPPYISIDILEKELINLKQAAFFYGVVAWQCGEGGCVKMKKVSSSGNPEAGVVERGQRKKQCEETLLMNLPVEGGWRDRPVQ